MNLKDNNTSVGERIKNIRLEKNLKQSELADLAGISRVSIGNYERGSRNPNIIILNKIANALNVTIGELTGLTTAPLTNDEFMSLKNRLDYELKINNGELLYKELDAENLEKLYLSKINEMKHLLNQKDEIIKTQKEMINILKSIKTPLLGGDQNSE